MPRGIFAKRASGFMRALFLSLNGETFTAVSSIDAPIVADEDGENIERTVNILADMKYVEVQRDENGNIALRLTPSGVTHSANFNTEVL